MAAPDERQRTGVRWTPQTAIDCRGPGALAPWWSRPLVAATVSNRLHVEGSRLSALLVMHTGGSGDRAARRSGRAEDIIAVSRERL
jgi:hypothetical protein